MTPTKIERKGVMMLEFRALILVGLGGLVGSIVRYKLGGFILHRSEGLDFPLSTFLVNVSGCLVIGILAALVERHDLFSPGARLFLFTGLLGGFTTFSAFGYESMFLIRRGLFGVASLYAMGSVVLGIAAVWLGMILTNSIWRSPH